jgi:hypothetical protein
VVTGAFPVRAHRLLQRWSSPCVRCAVCSGYLRRDELIDLEGGYPLVVLPYSRRRHRET